MPLVSCNDCRKEVSLNLEVCPHCGRVMPKELIGLLIRAIVMFGLIFMLLFF